MKYRKVYYFYKIILLLKYPIFQIVSLVNAGLWQVKLEGKVRFLGLPRFRNLGTIKIGGGTRIISDSRNLVGSYLKTSFETGTHGSIEIGKNCGLSSCMIIAQKSVIIGDSVYIGGGVRIYDNDFHSIQPEIRLNNPEIIPTNPISIGDKAFIGAHSIILKGVEIGENAVIGAGSIVTKSIAKNEIWAGVPAKKIGELGQK